MATFKPVSSKVSFPELEERILEFWKDRDIYHKTDEARKEAPVFTLYEGPPTANGTPGIHHVLARVFKDIIPRYKTMRGYRPERRGGWDTHGLPVELEIEKELGVSTKREIENLVPGNTHASIEKFNALCRESVMRYVKEWEDLTDRIGFWIDMPNAYVTFRNEYIETGWWILKTLWDRGMLSLGTKGAPHCPRCVTTLSSHEVALGYKEDTPDPSIFVRFRLPQEWTGGASRPASYDRLTQRGIPVSLLAWTTTPWTLPGNTALAVAPDAEYSVVELDTGDGRERLLLASDVVRKVVREEDARVVDTLAGADLVGLPYELLFDPGQYGMEIYRFPLPDRGSADAPAEVADRVGQRVIAADFVSMDDGTGIVHIAPAFGDEDLNAGRNNGLAYVQPVDLQGTVTGTYPFAGLFVKEADEYIIRDLEERGLLYHREIYRHTYPFCWRCDSPLLYYAKSSWYVRTTAVQERLVSGNQEINWYPGYIKDGRFGEWLRNNIDWALSRERYWGTPIPIWSCNECASYDCIGSIAELRERAQPGSPGSLSPERLDLHRPYVDELLITCRNCGGDMRRVPDVADAWFDSGAMPYAQAHVMSFDHLERLKQDGLFPAEYICEAVDQTRGWFYTLHALATFLAGEPSYRNVICLGLILDGEGYKMSKSRGNVVDPWEVVSERGADAVRWYMYTATPPGNPRRFSANLVGESVRRFMLTLWNVYSFFVTYANLDNFTPMSPREPITGLGEPRARGDLPRMDRWILSELSQLVVDVTRYLDEYNPTDAGRRIEDFVDVLSNWYVRRGRPRFWRNESDDDKAFAHNTLYACLTTVARLIAPFTPFVAEDMYQNLVRSVDNSAPESVHIEVWPKSNEQLIDKDLSEGMRLAMRVSSMGRAARSKAGVRVRQPLSRLLVKVRSAEEGEFLRRLASQVTDELNVKELETLEEETSVAEFSVRPNPRYLGPRLGADLPKVEQALQQADQAEIARAVGRGESIALGEITVEPQEISVNVEGLRGYVVVMEGGYTVALDTNLRRELVDEGMARELVHRIQNMRRSAGFDISDRIVTWCLGDEVIQRVVREHGDYIRRETLSLELREDGHDQDAHSEEHNIGQEPVTLAVKRSTE